MSVSLWLTALLTALAIGWLVGGRQGAVIALLTSLAWLLMFQVTSARYPEATETVVDLAPALAFLAIASALAVTMDRAVTWFQRAHRPDPETGLVQADSFPEVLQSELDRALRYDRPFSLLYLRSDLLAPGTSQLPPKDRRAIRLPTAAVLTSTLRSADLTAEVREGEFAVILPETGSEKLLAVAARLAAALPAPAGASVRRPVPMGAVTVIGTKMDSSVLLQQSWELMLGSARDGASGPRHVVLGPRSPAL